MRRFACWCALIVSSTLAASLNPGVADNEGDTALAARVVNGDVQEMLLDAGIEQLQEALAAGELTSQDLVRFYLERIERYDQRGPALNAVQALNPRALELAAAADAERRGNGARSLLHGIPVLVKDNYETAGMPTSAGSIALAEFAPARDAYLVQRLKDAGAIILGKTTMHEFAYGITTVGSRFGATRNPYGLERNPGGSSGGTGAAIAANFAAVGMGSDTCGSIRIPAAHNNLVGLRGTQGLSSRAGIVPLSSTQDIGGPLARSVRDLAIVLDATVGFDPLDEQTAESVGRIPASYLQDLRRVSGARIGILTDWLQQDVEDAEVAARIRSTLAGMSERAGWETVELASPALDESLQRPLNGHFVLVHDFKTDINAYFAANPEIGIENLAGLLADGRAHPAILGSLEASAEMDDASRLTYFEERAQRRVVRRALLRLMAEHELDALAYPTIRRIAAKHGEEQLGTNCRLAANSGLPAISVPAGFVQDMPVGLELLAEAWSEAKLLSLAYTVEHHHRERRLPAATP